MQISRKEVEKNYLRDGSFLKGIRAQGGAALGAMAGGWVFVGFGIFLGLLSLLASVKAGLAVFAFFGIPGGLLLLIGYSSRKKMLKNYMEYYTQSTGFSEEEVNKVEEELQKGFVAIGAINTEINRKIPVIGCLITDHYVIMPKIMGKGYIRRIEDMAAVAYSQTIPGVNGYKYGLVFVAENDKEGEYDARLDKKACLEIIDILSGKNPLLITAPSFTYDGKKYDIVDDAKAIAELYKSHKYK